MNAVRQGPPHGGTGLKRAKHRDRFDRCARQVRRHVVGDAGKSDHLDMDALGGRHRMLEVGAAVVLKSDGQCSAGNGLLDCIGVQRELVSECRSNEVGAVRIETFLHQQIDVAEIDNTDIDRQLLGFARPLPGL